MRKNYITSDYYYNNVYGSYNMIEESNFFGSKMLEIEDSIFLDKIDLIYYQNDKNEQLDINTEKILESKSYSSILSKNKNHKLLLDDKQSDYQKENLTKWILDINLSSILGEYIFAQMKTNRTFEGIRNNMTFNNNINASLIYYIRYNVLNRYKFSGIDIYIQYENLLNDSLYKWDNQYDETIQNYQNKIIRYETDLKWNQSEVKILLTQEKPSSAYNFKYYFNILFEKL